MEEYCQENGFAAWFETSARDNINIDEAARALVEKVRQIKNETITLENATKTSFQILEQDALLNSEAKKGSGQFSVTLDSNDQKNGRKSCSC